VRAYQKTHVLVIFSKPIILDEDFTDDISSSLGRGTGHAVTLEFLLKGDGVLSIIAGTEIQKNWARISKEGSHIYALKEDMDDRSIEVEVPTFRVINHNQLLELFDSNEVIIHY